jgi:hypothetical protein
MRLVAIGFGTKGVAAYPMSEVRILKCLLQNSIAKGASKMVIDHFRYN